MSATIKNLALFSLGLGIGVGSLEVLASGIALLSFWYAELSEA